MPSDKALLALHDIRDHIVLAREFVGGRTRAELVSDRRTLYAVCRCLEIVSEASRRLPQDIRDRHAQLPWRLIIGLGNVYRHDYGNVDEEIVWETMQHDLAPLAEAVEAEIGRLSVLPPLSD